MSEPLRRFKTDREQFAVVIDEHGGSQGTFPIHDLPDIGADLRDAPDGDYTTIAGLVLVSLGRIPTEPDDRVDRAQWTAEMTATEQNAITEVRLSPRGRPGVETEATSPHRP